MPDVRAEWLRLLFEDLYCFCRREIKVHMANRAEKSHSNIADYKSDLDATGKDIVDEIVSAIKESVPDASEAIRYRMPAFVLERTFIYFGVFKSHVGVYPPVKDEDLRKELKPYLASKGNLKFPLDKPIPYELIGKVAEALARQYSA